ncbi:MAG: hypothetical protein ACT4PE_00735 [Candidatus Eiseniibacteriota bacterium]
MRTRNSLQAVALVLAALPLLGGPCVEEKVIELVIGFPTTVRIEASGSQNVINFQSADIDLKADMDIEGALDDAGIDVNDVGTDAATQTADVKVSQIFYRVIQPDAVANRQITNASLRVARLDAAGVPIPGGDQVLVTGWSNPAGVGNVADPTAWIDITNIIGVGGLNLLNTYMYDLIVCLQTGTPITNPNIRYQYSGTSSPTGQATLFEYEIKIVFQGIIPQTFDVPFGNS